MLRDPASTSRQVTPSLCCMLYFTISSSHHCITFTYGCSYSVLTIISIFSHYNCSDHHVFRDIVNLIIVIVIISVIIVILIPNSQTETSTFSMVSVIFRQAFEEK